MLSAWRARSRIEFHMDQSEPLRFVAGAIDPPRSPAVRSRRLVRSTDPTGVSGNQRSFREQTPGPPSNSSVPPPRNPLPNPWRDGRIYDMRK